MNKTNIEWCTMSWNPVTGCFHLCRKTYCYNTIKSTSPLNRFGARYADQNGVMLREPDWQNRETGKCHLAKQGEIYPFGYDPTFYRHRLVEPEKMKAPQRIFVVDTGDLFGAWVPQEWITDVIDVTTRCPQHTFILLTKNPARYLEFNFPANCW